MNEVKKKRLCFAIVIIAVLLSLVALIVFFVNKGQQETTKKEITKYVQSQQYKHESTKDWTNGSWLGTLNKEKVETIKFVSAWNGTAAQGWMFDGLRCYYNDGTVYVVVGSNMKIKGAMNGAFACLTNLKSISGFQNIDTSEVEDMSYLFQDCTSLENLDITDLEMDSVKNAEGMFMNCVGLSEIDMSENNLENATNMSRMFYECKGLNRVVLPKMRDVKTMASCFENIGTQAAYNASVEGTLNTSCLEDASYMFSNTCLYSYSIVESMDTSNLINAEGMFYNCSVDKLDLSSWNVKNLETIEKMFYSDMSLVYINTAGWNVSSLKNCEDAFYMCTSLKEINFGWENVPNIKHAASLFKYCFYVTSMDLSCFDGVHFGDAREMFMNCDDLVTIYGKGFAADVSDKMFFECFELVGTQKYTEDKLDVTMANTNGYMTLK